MQAGKDVYVEKPVSHNVSEGRRMVEVARKYNRICQTGTQCRSNKGMQDAIKYVHDGKIGKLKVARGLCYKRRPSIGPLGDYPIPKGVNYDLWLGPAQYAPLTREPASTTTGTAVCTTATATWATRAFTRWTCAAGVWASTSSATRCSATADGWATRMPATRPTRR